MEAYKKYETIHHYSEQFQNFVAILKKTWVHKNDLKEEGGEGGDSISEIGKFLNKKSYTCIMHTEIYFCNIIKSNRNQVAYTLFRLIRNQTDVHLVPKQS